MYRNYTLTTTHDLVHTNKFITIVFLNGKRVYTTRTSHIEGNTVKSAKRWVDLQIIEKEG